MSDPWMVDVHTHIFPEWVQQNRWEFVNRDPVFREIYGNEKARMVTGRELVAAMDEEEVALSVTFGFPWADQGLNRDHNDAVLEAASAFPDRLIPFACLNPLAPGAGSEAARCIDKGAKGIGEIAFYDRVIDEEVIAALRPVMAVLRDANLPLLIHTNEPVGHPYPGKSMQNIREIELLVRSFPDNLIILAHWGGGILFYELMKEIRALFRNVYYDTAASPYLYRPEIFPVAAHLIGHERILMGTDFPLIRPRRYLKQVRESLQNDPQVRDICRENALTLFRSRGIL